MNAHTKVKSIGKNVMGQRDGFSPLDIQKVNRMYRCEADREPKEPPIELPERVPSRFPFDLDFANLGTFIGNIFTGFRRFG